MNATQVFDILETITATSARKEKEAIVKQHINDPMFAKVLQYAYDPTVSFYMSEDTVEPILEETVRGENVTTFSEDSRVWTFLDRLSDRSISGNEAKERVAKLMAMLDEKSASVAARIILKDLRAGFASSTILKASPNLIPDFPYMRCTLPKDSDIKNFDWSKGVYSQFKADGSFVNVSHYVDGKIMLVTRNGTRYPNTSIQNLVDSVANLKKGFQYHGEMLVYKNNELLSRSEGNGILNSLAKGGDIEEGYDVRIQLWDCIPLEKAVTKGRYEVPYRERFDQLTEIVKNALVSRISVIDNRIVYSLAEAIEHYKEVAKAGFEGTVVKSADAIWFDGNNKSQVKFKLAFRVEMVITGFNKGYGKNASTFGSVLGESADGKVVCGISAFKDADRKKFSDERDSMIGKIIEVECNDVVTQEDSDQWALFLPRFKELRTDKNTANTFEEIMQHKNNAIENI
jgi:DNA ligase-1